jgi:hypothetical protein
LTTPSRLTLIGTARRFGLEPDSLSDPRIEALVQERFDLDREIDKRRAGALKVTDDDIRRIGAEYRLDATEVCGPVRSVCKGVGDARRFLAALRPAKLAPPAAFSKPTLPKEEKPLCFLTK